MLDWLACPLSCSLLGRKRGQRGLFDFSLREACKKSGVSLILFLAPYSVASEDSALNNFSLRKARDKLELTYQFCHVW